MPARQRTIGRGIVIPPAAPVAAAAGLAASAMTATHQAVYNAINGTGGAVTPTTSAGGLLLIGAMTSGAGAHGITIGGTRTGTWTERASGVMAIGHRMTIFTCSDYGAAGTVSASTSGAWITYELTFFKDVGLLNLADPVQQYKLPAASALLLDVTYDVLPTYSLYGVFTSSSGALSLRGSNTLLNYDATWNRIATAFQQQPSSTMGITAASGTADGLVLEFKRA